MTLTTRLLLAGLPVVLCLYDMAAYFVAGNAATISYQLGLAGIASPLVVLGVGYGSGLFAAHVFSLTQTPVPPPDGGP
jgi:hypothetical protein